MIKKYISRLVVILLTVFMLLGISGCAETEDSVSKLTTTSIKTSEETNENEITTELDSEIGEIQNQEDNEELPVSQIPVNVQSSNENISLSNIPAYTGNAYVAVNNNNPYLLMQIKAEQMHLKHIATLTGQADVVWHMQIFVRK